MTSRFKPQGSMADLNDLQGMKFFNAHRGTPTTEIEATRPFMLRYQPIAEGESVTEVIACYRDNEHVPGRAEDWFVSFPEHSADNDVRFFQVVFLQDDHEEYSYAWNKVGKRTLNRFLTPFINQDEGVCGSITGVTEKLRDENIDLTHYAPSYLNLLLHSAEEIARFCEKRNIAQILISHSTTDDAIETLVYLNAKDLKVSKVEIDHERTSPFHSHFDFEDSIQF